ncbi:MAG: hypothetical protein GY725_15750 [bacterium]|nr:hypothetical protein [bacterium]
MSRLASGLLPLVVCACFGASISRSPVPEAEAIGFHERARSFYQALESVPLDALVTYEDPELKTYFAGPAAFADYYSSLADAVRSLNFRDGRVASLEIQEFRFERPDFARVELRISGKHQRRLRFWEMEMHRTDSWRRVDGVWLVSPDKL